ncbi:MAG: nitroreductase/quinone reductase family protein [Rudaea sp.]
MRVPRRLWRWMHLAQVPLARNPRAPIGRLVLLLTTVGRRSGRKRVTPLQYEEVEGTIFVASARGEKADWFKNLVACPQVHVQVGTRQLDAVAEPITDPARIADFLELRLERHPIMMGMMMLLEGVGPRPSRAQLEDAAARLALAALHPVGTSK